MFDIAEFRLDTGQGTVCRGGERLPLPPKAVEILAALAENAGRVVGKQELLDTVWSDATVEEGNLAKQIFLLRQHLGNDAIETVPKRGYRLAAAATIAPQAPVVAVLPFRDLSAERDLEHLCEGIAEEILGVLGRIGGIEIVARASAFRLARQGLDARGLGAALGATALVEGSVRCAGGRVRVTARLVDAAAGRERWSETLERPRQDLLAIEEEIAAAVARSLRPDARGPAARLTPNFEAYELYLQGRYLWNRRPGEVVWRALECFERAIAIDPSFAAAFAGIADVYSTLGSWEAGVLPHAEAQAKARSYAARALALDPALPEAHTTLAYTALHYDRDLAAAEAGFRRALSIDPRYATAHHWRAHAFVAGGRFDEARAASELALASDPMNLLLNIHLAWHWHMARVPEKVVEQAARVVKMDAGFHWGHYFAGWGAEALGDFDGAVAAFARAVACADGDAVMMAGHARALALAGDVARARRMAAELDRRGAPHDLYAYELALVHLGLGELDAAVALVERAIAVRSGWIVYARVDPRLDPVRARLQPAL